MAGIARLHTIRARRFPLRIPLRYRKSGIPVWQEATTLNISRTGILFHTDESLQLKSTLDIRITFPSNVILSCQGSVVRAIESSIAVRIHRHNLHHA